MEFRHLYVEIFAFFCVLVRKYGPSRLSLRRAVKNRNNEEMQNYCRADGLLPRFDGTVRESAGTRLRYARGTGVCGQRLGKARRNVRERVADDVALCDGVVARS